MADLKALTVRALRELARKYVGPGYSHLKTKSELLAAVGNALPRSIRDALEPQAAPSPASDPKPAQTSSDLALDDEETAASEPDPEGFMVSRVAGEQEVRRAQMPLVEEKVPPAMEDEPPPARFDEDLGELPESYGEDSVVLLAKDPRSAYLYWDFSHRTLTGALEWAPGVRTKLRLYADGQLVRESDFALDSRSWYFNDLEPGRTYRAELVSLSGDGQVRRVGPSSNSVRLPIEGPSSVIDDRFLRIPFDLSPGRLTEAIRQVQLAKPPEAPFPAESRDALFRMSQGLARSLGASQMQPRPPEALVDEGGRSAPEAPVSSPLSRGSSPARSSGPWIWSGSSPRRGGA